MRHWLGAVALAAAMFLFGGGTGQAADELSLAAFHGRWQGTAMSESDVSVYFQLTARDLDVAIAPAGEGFRVSWTTVQRQKGDPGNPTVERKTQEIVFAPSGRRGLWRQQNAGDPLAAPYAWAALRGSTLTVNILAIAEDGGFEVQVYDRTLTDAGMELQFSRLENGEQVRRAKGRLVKVARQ